MATKSPQPKTKRKPLGKPLPLSDQDLDMAALVTPQDIEQAKAHAAQFGTARFNALLNAARLAGANA